MINVLINGFEGRMGQEVYKQTQNSDKFNFVAGLDEHNNIDEIFDKKIDVIVDFSTPSGTMNILEFANKKHIPIVIATTGFSEEQLETIKNSSKDLPIFKSSNMSYETNLMISVVSKLAKELTNSDIEIVETHHRNKVDAPSGTALMIADNINNALNNSMHYEFDRHSKKAPRDKKEIGIHSIRGGTEVGKHSVFFFGENESLEISHTTTSRAVFASGALKAAEYIITKSNGMYDMNDLVALKNL